MQITRSFRASPKNDESGRCFIFSQLSTLSRNVAACYYRRKICIIGRYGRRTGNVCLDYSLSKHARYRRIFFNFTNNIDKTGENPSLWATRYTNRCGEKLRPVVIYVLNERGTLAHKYFSVRNEVYDITRNKITTARRRRGHNLYNAITYVRFCVNTVDIKVE